MLKSKYANLADIPEWARPLYTQQGSEWVWKQDAVEGLAELLNTGLAANRDALRNEKNALENAIAAANTRASQAEARAASAAAPGSVVLSPEQGRLWQRYEALGKPAELEAIKTEHGQLKTRVAHFDQLSEIENVAKMTGLNADALKAEAPLRFAGVKIVSKDVTVTENGQPVVKKAPFVQYTQNLNGQNVVQEAAFVDYCRANGIQDYVINAITGQGQAPAPQQQTQAPIIFGQFPQGQQPGALPTNNGQPAQPIQPAPFFGQTHGGTPAATFPTGQASNYRGNVINPTNGVPIVIDAQALLNQANAERGVQVPNNNGGNPQGGQPGQMAR